MVDTQGGNQPDPPGGLVEAVRQKLEAWLFRSSGDAAAQETQKLVAGIDQDVVLDPTPVEDGAPVAAASAMTPGTWDGRSVGPADGEMPLSEVVLSSFGDGTRASAEMRLADALDGSLGAGAGAAVAPELNGYEAQALPGELGAQPSFGDGSDSMPFPAAASDVGGLSDGDVEALLVAAVAAAVSGEDAPLEPDAVNLSADGDDRGPTGGGDAALAGGDEPTPGEQPGVTTSTAEADASQPVNPAAGEVNEPVAGVQQGGAAGPQDTDASDHPAGEVSGDPAGAAESNPLGDVSENNWPDKPQNGSVDGVVSDTPAPNEAPSEAPAAPVEPTNLLAPVDGNLSFAEDMATPGWSQGVNAAGQAQLGTTIETVDGATYNLEFGIAANLAADTTHAVVEVAVDGTVVEVVEQSGGVFSDQSVSFVGGGGEQSLTFTVVDTGPADDGSPEIDTSGVVATYEREVSVGGETVTVEAFAPGQSNVYQILNGQLHSFDLDTDSYTAMENEAGLDINAIGFNTGDDLLYGVARASGEDSLGHSVTKGDVVMIDATGASYKMADTGHDSFIGDVDSDGNLWVFSSGGGTATTIDLSTLGEEGPDTTTYKVQDVPKLEGLADLAYDAETETFYGVSHQGNGKPGTLVKIDVSEVADGGSPVMESEEIRGIIVDGEKVEGITGTAYGAVMLDSDGNVYAGGNGGDHDLDRSTKSSGGFYKVTEDPETGELWMELLAAPPSVNNNDGAMDQRGVDPFSEVDDQSDVLIREPSLMMSEAPSDAAEAGPDAATSPEAGDAAGSGEDSSVLAGVDDEAPNIELSDDLGPGDSLSGTQEPEEGAVESGAEQPLDGRSGETGEESVAEADVRAETVPSDPRPAADDNGGSPERGSSDEDAPLEWTERPGNSGGEWDDVAAAADSDPDALPDVSGGVMEGIGALELDSDAAHAANPNGFA